MGLRKPRLTGVAAASAAAIPLVLLASVAKAQPSMPTAGPPGALDAPVGSGVMERRMVVRLQARAVYDNAVTRGVPTFVPGATERQRQDDILYSPNARLDILQPIGAAYYGFAQGNVGYQFYQKEPKLDGARVGVSSGVGGQLGRCQGSLAGNYARSQRDTEDLTLGVTRSIRESMGAQVSSSCAAIAGIQVQLGANYNRSTNSRTRGTVDSEAYGFSGGLGYGNRALGSISLVGQYQVSEYQRGNLGPGLPMSSGTKVYSVGLQYSRPIGTRLMGRIGLGYVTVDPSDSVLPSRQTFSADVNLLYSPTERLSASFSYRRGIVPSNIAGIDYTISGSARIGVSYALSDRLQASAGVSYRSRSNKGVIDLDLVGAPRNDDSLSYSASLSASIGRKSTVSLDATYQDRSTNVQSLSYDSVRVGITASTSF